jgi:hypothetical protein
MVATIKFSQFAAVSLANNTNKVVGVTALSGGSNFYSDFPLTWITANRPATPGTGVMGYNTSLGQYEYWNGASWIQLAAGGSGSVNVGAANQLAYYAANGSSVSGLMSANNSVLTTNSGGAPSWNTTLPASLTIPTPNITGVTNGSSAAGGSVGQVYSAVVLFSAPVSLTSNVPADLTSLSLPAGDYDYWGNVGIGATGVFLSQAAMWISTSSATVPEPSQNSGMADSGSLFQTFSTAVPGGVHNSNGSNTLYLSALGTFGSGTASAWGQIFARRRR